MVRKHTKNCPVPLVPTTVDLQVILNEVLAKYKILRVPTKSIHLENGGASPLTFTPEGALMKFALVLHWFSLKCPEGFFFLSGFFFTNIYQSQDCRGRGRVFL